MCVCIHVWELVNFYMLSLWSILDLTFLYKLLSISFIIAESLVHSVIHLTIIKASIVNWVHRTEHLSKTEIQPKQIFFTPRPEHVCSGLITLSFKSGIMTMET